MNQPLTSGNSKNILSGKKILLLDKVLARGKKHHAVNGAERFNLNLAAELVNHGAELSIEAAKNWNSDLNGSRC